MLLDVLLHSTVRKVNLGYLLCYLLPLLVEDTRVLLFLGHARPPSLHGVLAWGSCRGLVVFKHLAEHSPLLSLGPLLVLRGEEVVVSFIVLLSLLKGLLRLLNRGSGEAVRRAIIVIDRTSPSYLQPVLSQVEYRNYLIALNLRFAAYVSILLIEDSFPVSSVRHPIIDYQPEHSHLRIVPVSQEEISADNLGHRSRPLLAIFEYPLAEGRSI